ncbi:ROK family protein [Arthrobacter castelli]|uniref:ROK family protein n=1 Tax=Arthrobacter castelli TaxID=271431 RepID=UPI000427C6FD|nr:ROK family protein [Arthrobacter castelli]
MATDATGAPASSVLEIGGTHVTAAVVEHTNWTVKPDSLFRLPLQAAGSAGELVDAMERAASGSGDAGAGGLTVAIPGPFDYERGVGEYRDVGKFESLAGFDLRTELSDRLNLDGNSIAFINDAEAFGIGEYALGAASGYRRAVCITLGTGVGSVFLDNGLPVRTGTEVPPHGTAHRLEYRGRPLEETVSRRAVRAAYTAAVSPDRKDGDADVHEIASLAHSGDPTAVRVLETAFAGLGEALGAYVHAFGAGVLVVGGSVARSWDLVAPALRSGLVEAVPELRSLPVRAARHPELAPLSGAAFWSAHRS